MFTRVPGGPSPHEICLQVGRCHPDGTPKVDGPSSGVMTNPQAK
jgi:hypothetical protein